MKKYLYTPLFILLALSITNCQGSNVSQLEATNAALNNQLNTLLTQLTQQASSPIQTAQEPIKASTESIAPTEFPVASASPLPAGGVSSYCSNPDIFWVGYSHSILK